MDKYSSLKTLLVEIKDNIAYLTFNRPQAMNTYNEEMSRELPDCMECLAEDSNIKVIVLKGAGKLFMAGGDLDFLRHACGSNQEHTMAAIASLNETILSMQTMDKLVVAAVHGACAGAGLSLMLAADFAYCANGTKFNTAYANLGLSPDGGMSYTLPRVVGHKKALELILLSKPFLADEAHSLGLVNHVFSAEVFENEIQNIAEELAKRPQQTVASIKTLLRNSQQNNLQQQLSNELENFVLCTKTKDFKLGVEAFLNKTAANFGG